MSAADPREVFRGDRFPWPFPNDEFPDQLAVAVSHTVALGQAPALDVFHFADLDWAVGDGVGPLEAAACGISHMAHLVASDPSLLELVTMPPGRVARRDSADAPWVIIHHRADDA